MNLFPPFFPETPYLRLRLWHKIIWVISSLISIDAIYSIAAMLIIITDRYGFFNIKSFEALLTLPMVPLLLPMFQPNDPSNFNFSLYANVNEKMGLWLLLLYFVFWAIIPGILYKFFLNQTIGKIWNQKNISKKRSK